MDSSQISDGEAGASASLLTPQSSTIGQASAGTSLIAATALPAFMLDGVTTTGTGPGGTAASPVGTGVDQAINGPTARNSFGVTGAGIKIGILSDSFNVLGGAA